MKLYDCAMAPNPRRARMFLAEKGITVPMVEVDIVGGENLQPAYLAINPRGLLPTLVLDDGTRIDEVMAICRYFEALYPWRPLLGRTPVECARVECMQRRAEFDGMIAGSEVFRNQHPKFAARSIPGGGAQTIPAIPALVERGRQTLARFFDWLESTLTETPWLVGDALTMADITAFCAIDFAGWVDIRIPDQHVAVQRWYESMNTRPSARA